MKRIVLFFAVGLGLAGCQTIKDMTPCERALRGLETAQQVYDTVCPLANPPKADFESEGIY